MGQGADGGEVVALYGELGTGKTTLIRGLAAGLGADSGVVSSPTFVLIHEYAGRLTLVHADLYRIASEDDLRSIGLVDHFTEHTVTAIEWADRGEGVLPTDRLDVRLCHRSPRTRTVSLFARGDRGRRFLDTIKQLYRQTVRRSGRKRELRVPTAKRVAR